MGEVSLELKKTYVFCTFFDFKKINNKKMSSCNGRGECLQQCICSCYEDDDCNIPSVNCICGHRDHIVFTGGKSRNDKYCRKHECRHNCNLQECKNFDECGTKCPQEILDYFLGICVSCAMLMGFQNTKECLDECPFCAKKTSILVFHGCEHKICQECWCDITNEPLMYNPLCICCRKLKNQM